ncbi:MAG: DUF6580 family putative transport protein [Leptospira sp.]|nr:DUF6580 family putative transport protein [Leptospira sp.]
MSQSRILTAILMVLVAVASRILPHPPNFNPILAVSLFSGAYLLDKKFAYAVPLVAMLLSDLVIGFHALMPVIYLSMALFVFLGAKLSSSPKIGRTFTLTLASSVFFFIITNFAVWLTSGMYSLDFQGLVFCFTQAIPFFQNSLASDLLYTGVLFGSMIYLDRTVFASEKPVLVK